MRQYAWLGGLLMVVFLALFGIVVTLNIELLEDPSAWMEAPGPLAAGIGVGLLIADVLIPVPSTIVMIAHGALFGIAGGTLLSLIGCLGAAWLGFGLGRRGGPLLERLISDEERARADALFRRYGPLAIVITRPIPIVAETVALLAGTSREIGWIQMSVATVAGALPACLLLAITGATTLALDDMLLMFGVVLAIAGVFWWIGRKLPSDPASG